MLKFHLSEARFADNPHWGAWHPLIVSGKKPWAFLLSYQSYACNQCFVHALILHPHIPGLTQQLCYLTNSIRDGHDKDGLASLRLLA